VKVFCGRIPKEIFEDELIPLFEKCGTVWDLRLMMDPMSGYNRSFCFVTFTEKTGASEAVKQVTAVYTVHTYWQCVTDNHASTPPLSFFTGRMLG